MANTADAEKPERICENADMEVKYYDMLYEFAGVVTRANWSNMASVSQIFIGGVIPKIKDSGSSAIEDVIDNDDNAPVEYYNLQGVRINEPAAGQVVIRRQGSKVSKIVVR